MVLPGRSVQKLRGECESGDEAPAQHNTHSGILCRWAGGDTVQACVLDGLVTGRPQDVPEPVQSDVGYALFAAQRGEEYRSVKSLQGFGGRGVLEIVVPHDGDAYRAVYTVRFKDSIYVLHAFQKKSTRGIATPKREIELVRRRLADAERHHRERLKSHGEEDQD